MRPDIRLSGERKIKQYFSYSLGRPDKTHRASARGDMSGKRQGSEAPQHFRAA
jgi:hypothetical protein